MNVFAPSSTPPSAPLSLEANIRDAKEIAPETDGYGGVEYKLHLNSPSPDRMERLVTQLKWRLNEGGGKAIYVLGVADDGSLVGLHAAEYKTTMITMQAMAKMASARIDETKTVPLKDNRIVAEISLSAEAGEDLVDIRIALIGVHAAGKSSLLGAICHGVQDNGRGLARYSLLRHLHEIKTGETSSIAREILGFTLQGLPVTYHTPNLSSWDDIVRASHKAIIFHDCPGKNIKTLIRGVWDVDWAGLVVPADTFATDSQQIELIQSLNIQFFIIISKVDAVTRQNLKTGLEQLCEKFRDLGYNPGFDSSCFPRILFTSAVSMSGFDKLSALLFALPCKSKNWSEAAVFGVQETFHEDSILSGYMYSGKLHIGDTVTVYPSRERRVVESIHRQRLPCSCLATSGTIQLTSRVPNARGMVLSNCDNLMPQQRFDLVITYGKFEGEGFAYYGGKRLNAQIHASRVELTGTSDIILAGMVVLLVDLSHVIRCAGFVKGEVDSYL